MTSCPSLHSCFIRSVGCPLGEEPSETCRQASGGEGFRSGFHLLECPPPEAPERLSLAAIQPFPIPRFEPRGFHLVERVLLRIVFIFPGEAARASPDSRTDRIVEVPDLLR